MNNDNINSASLLTINAMRHAAYSLGCVLHTPKLKNQAYIRNIVSNATINGGVITRKEIQRELGFSQVHTAKLLRTMVKEGLLAVNLNGKPSRFLVGKTRKGATGQTPYTFTISAA